DRETRSLQRLQERHTYWRLRFGRSAAEVADDRHRLLLRARRKRARHRRAAEQGDELASFQLIEEHPVPYQPGPDGRISNWPWSVSGYQGVCTICPLLAKPAPDPLWVANIGFFVGHGLSSARPE